MASTTSARSASFSSTGGRDHHAMPAEREVGEPNRVPARDSGQSSYADGAPRQGLCWRAAPGAGRSGRGRCRGAARAPQS
eukprot:804935-Prymnesium_polylepis.1